MYYMAIESPTVLMAVTGYYCYLDSKSIPMHIINVKFRFQIIIWNDIDEYLWNKA